MKITNTTIAALLLTTTAATAGGLDRSGQSIGALFEEGSYVELSYGYVTPDVTGSAVTPGPVLNSGNVGATYGNAGLAFKMDVDENVSVALIVDQPFGAAVDYAAGTGYPLAGSNAEIRSTGLTVLGRYKFNENYSIHFGPRVVQMEGNATVVTGAGIYDATYQSDSGTGYVVGAAYERPEIALRIALSYSSAIALSHKTTVTGVPDAVVTNTEYTVPQSVNLDFQSGVAADTLVFGGVRWAEWTETEINSFAYPGNPLVGYDNDTTTYTLGVGRKFSDSFSGAISVSYEEAQGGIADNLSPTDGSTSISVGGTYAMGNGIELTGGIRYVMVGDAETRIPVPGLGVLEPQFTDNSAVAVGLKIAYNF